MKGFSLFFFISSVLYCCINETECLRTEKILNGQEARPGQIKYQISVQMNGYPRCGGGIIGDKFGITAAHCFVDEVHGLLVKAHFSILIADNVMIPEETAIRIQISKLYIPRSFVPVTIDPTVVFYSVGDIAVFELEYGLESGNNFSFAALKIPELHASHIRKTAIVAGHGFHKINYIKDVRSNEELQVKYTNGQLRFGAVNTMSNRECSDMFDGRKFYGNSLCAQMIQTDAEKPVGICGGDSGSPLVYNDEVCIGISIAGPYDCNETDEPGIYTRVSHYAELINNTLNGRITQDIFVAQLVQKSPTEFEFISV